MHPQVIRDEPGECPICHMKLTPLTVGSSGATQSTTPGGSSVRAGGKGPAGEQKIKYWWDPMLSPPYISDKPGKSPMGMDLVPVYEDEAPSGTGIIIDPTVVQNMGVRTASVTEGRLSRTVRAVGYLDQAQPNIRDVNLLVSGWIRRLYADTEGMHVREGDPLFELYSPELQVAVEELIGARRTSSRMGDDGVSRQSANVLYGAAVRKLELWGLGRSQIESLAKLDRPSETVTFRSPITGHVAKKSAVEGAAVKAGDQVFQIVDHSVLWVDSRVFEQDLPLVTLGQKAKATLIARPGEIFAGEVIFIHPHLDMMTRTATVRIAIPNESLRLRPGMYATVTFETEVTPKTLLVPREAVIDTGTRQVAFVALGDGHFEARQVRMGLSGADGLVQILEGLLRGEQVVTSGQFLLDSESRLREAVQKFLREQKGAKTPGSMADPTAGMATGSSEGMKPTDAPVEPEWQAAVDAVVTGYLEFSAALGAAGTVSMPVDPGSLVREAHALHGALRGSEHEEKVADIAKAAEALEGQQVDRQRELFKALSAATISLAKALRPSTAVGEELFVVHCPMSEADWIQTTSEIANPYFSDSMKQCGEITATIKPVGARSSSQ